MLALAELVLASEQQIEAFTVKLDTWDTATVEALMQNEEELLAVRERIASMLLDSHVLPDGRRVFKTRDGTKVFDEFGSEILPDVLSPDDIANDKARWEDLLEARLSANTLEREREELLAYQEKLDDARERLDDDPALTEDDLAALEDELGEAMPARVTAILNREAGGPAPEPEARAAIEQVRDKLAPQNLPVPSGP